MQPMSSPLSPRDLASTAILQRGRFMAAWKRDRLHAVGPINADARVPGCGGLAVHWSARRHTNVIVSAVLPLGIFER